MKIVKYDNGDYGITDKSGNYGIVPPLYFGQMTYKNKKGKYILAHNVPENYFRKVAFLDTNGWYRCYHYDLWLKSDKDTDYGLVISTDDALRNYPEFKL